MTEKKSWMRMFVRVVGMKTEEISDELWQELFNLAKGFQQFADNHWLASINKVPKWEKKFVEEMVNRAERRIGWWKRIARSVDKNSPEWKKAIEMVWSGTINRDILYRWEELKWLLPENHPYFEDVKEQVKRLKRKRREKREIVWN